jgi:rSAM/selenodomain-associated transferase 1
LVFARTPRPGAVKTRLTSHLTPEQACALHIAMIEDTAELARRFPGRRRLLFSEEIVWLDLPPGFEVGRQADGDLGERLVKALADGFADGAHKIVVLGSDSPHLPPARLRKALEALDQVDMVLGPAEDGGYYLVGVRRFSPEIFHGVEWGGPRACAQTRAAAERAGFTVAALDLFYDLDEWQDLERLKKEGAIPLGTAPRVLRLLAG